jgi:hypothetical protein
MDLAGGLALEIGGFELAGFEAFHQRSYSGCQREWDRNSALPGQRVEMSAVDLTVEKLVAGFVEDLAEARSRPLSD